MFEIWSKLTIKVPASMNDVNHFTVNFEHISRIVLVFPSLTLNKKSTAGNILSKTKFEQQY